ncbi:MULTISPECIES: gephyrin-like molybdotransferase Glp [unclassified Ensifer]|uniref:molybdopterin molybdotransferase MoeA n=1 Tax=unclassified Ensifer TaxID=2633371 RepID=UPI000813C884|nr:MULTISPECIES: gephyrin-like molybdotransferase Glp [unclassified Ensifer]OCP00999.1 molybdopterin molybdenumtransferase MoeA [Ensifer sp. LC11]OCP01572.1 molybdopterin molybdenumtransferase MoeA [Ensifer sp. LC13]OCP02120.1 molybdopterin molybdenumtransferase MoeA [Ensifer sp. LC14]OCP30048.1 molybdopterin molybdenumtransferase MoeA [Ensifer sp. LC499]
MSLLSVEDALERILRSATPRPLAENVALHDGLGRVLSQDIPARVTHPAFDNSAMDGYAVRHQDIETIGAELTVIGQSAAGHRFKGEVAAGQTVRIFTGAPLPAGADTVIIQEDTERLPGNRIRTKFVPGKGRHIRLSGQDFTAGEAALSAGDVLDAGRLTLAAGMNHANLPVFRRPRVAILATGDELMPPGSKPGDDQIIASNSFGVAAIARDNGAEVIDLGIVGDDQQAIAAQVARAQGADVDVIVTLGGASVGDHDLVQATLLACGMTLDFWRIAMRPGKPLMVGQLGVATVLGLPGNPVSSLVCSLLFLEPLVRKLARLPERERIATARLASPLPGNDIRQDYVRARLSRDSDGNLVAHPFSRQDSSMMKVFAQSDCLIVRAPHAEEAPLGTSCDILRLR